MAMVITQKVLGNGVTPPPFWEKFPKNSVFFLAVPPYLVSRLLQQLDSLLNPSEHARSRGKDPVLHVVPNLGVYMISGSLLRKLWI